MDYARLTDNKGNKADFRNVILIMTSNAGAQYAGQAGIGFGGGLTKGQAMLNTVKKTFKPEFLNRLSGTVVFNEMDKTMASLILDKKLRQLSQRLASKNVSMTLSQEAHEFLLVKGFTKQYGAREMDRAIQQYLTPMLMEELLFGKLKKGGEAKVDVADEHLVVS
jgi:ATP-dependent Clp protease ATP-binding subunit ClpA